MFKDPFIPAPAFPMRLSGATPASRWPDLSGFQNPVCFPVIMVLNQFSRFSK
jgi:hypothetical protein